MATADHLSEALVRRLRDRAQDSAGRSDDAALAAQSVGFEDALRTQREQLAAEPDEVQAGVRDYLGGVNSPLAGMIQNTVTGDGTQARGLLGALARLTGGKQLFAMTGAGVMSLGGAVESRPAPPPAAEEAVAAAEGELGFTLPAGLRQFYLEVADGGVGPGGGVFSLSELVAKHHELTDEPIGPQNQAWPAELIAIQGEDWDLFCLDRDTGRIVYWDLEELDDDDELPPDQPTWAASFVPEADSLEAWLSAWAGR